MGQHITLYVHDVKFHPKLPKPGDDVTVIDVELSEQAVKEICQYFSKQIEDDEFIGSIRMRFSGRMVLS